MMYADSQKSSLGYLRDRCVCALHLKLRRKRVRREAIRQIYKLQRDGVRNYWRNRRSR